MYIWPSLIAAHLMNLQKSIDSLSPHVCGWHIDVMDNHFVPNLTWGAQFINAIAQHSTKPLWIHLMIDNPECFLDTLCIPKGTYITFHIETKVDVSATIKAIKAQGWKAGLAVNPQTPIGAVFSYLDAIDQVLIMSVEPGFSGQTFMPDTLKKIAPLKRELELEHHNKSVALAIDGGITREIIVEIAQLGITQFGIASGIFSLPNPTHEVECLNQLLANIW